MSAVGECPGVCASVCHSVCVFVCLFVGSTGEARVWEDLVPGMRDLIDTVSRQIHSLNFEKAQKIWGIWGNPVFNDFSNTNFVFFEILGGQTSKKIGKK